MEQRASLAAAAPVSLAAHLLVLAAMDPHTAQGPAGPRASLSPTELVSMELQAEPPRPADTAAMAEGSSSRGQPTSRRARRAHPANRGRAAEPASPAAQPAGSNRGRAAEPASPAAQPAESPMPAWMRRSIGDPRWVDNGEPGSLLDAQLSGPLDLERHSDGSITFRGDGVEGCRYPDGTIQTRAEGGDGDPCCHADAIDECGCAQDDADPAARAAVLERLQAEL